MESTHPTPVIYALHSGDLQHRYVGTSKNHTRRLYEHRSRARHGHSAPVYQWMRDVGIHNIHMVILEPSPTREEANRIEAKWIAQLLQLGYNLLNEDARDGIPHSKSPRGMQNLQLGQRTTPSTARPVTVNGTRYTSIHQAAKRAGIDPATITKYSNRLGDVPLNFRTDTRGYFRLVV
ncbi:TPA: GIY-YIG nuclease family protein [Shigella flexneri]|nr:GIY-YIG nuclease family protein [Shigella flexneri]